MLEKRKFILSYSAGKDSTLALYRMIKMGHEPLALITTMNGKEERSWFHGVTEKMLEKVCESLDIPIRFIDTTADEYTKCFSKVISELKDDGATACVFGDIDIQEHKDWWLKICDDVGIEGLWPLWNEDREALVREFVDEGFKAKIKVVNTNFLDASYLSRILDNNLIDEIKNKGVDPSGEGGEFHTFVYDGPLFKKKIVITQSEIVYKDNYAMIDYFFV